MPPDAGPEVIRASWKDLVRRHHPDLVARRGAPAITHLAEELTILSNRAYDRLRASLVADLTIQCLLCEFLRSLGIAGGQSLLRGDQHSSVFHPGKLNQFWFRATHKLNFAGRLLLLLDVDGAENVAVRGSQSRRVFLETH